MVFVCALFLLLYLPSLCTSRGLLWPRDGNKKEPSNGYYDPRASGGSMLTSVPNTYPPGLGEPLNGVIVGTSDPTVLVDSEIGGGLRNFFLSAGFSGECLGQHSGSDQAANLGDGDGYKNETAVIRWNYGDPALGSCKETIQGGNHFRYWVQDGPQANSSAVFIAFSYELPIAAGHDIVLNGYNLARDYFVGNLTGYAIPTPSLTNPPTYQANTSFGNYTYQTQITYAPGLLQNSSVGINHYITVAPSGLPAIDGLVAVMDIKIIERPKSSAQRLTPWFSLSDRFPSSSFIYYGMLCIPPMLLL